MAEKYCDAFFHEDIHRYSLLGHPSQILWYWCIQVNGLRRELNTSTYTPVKGFTPITFYCFDDVGWATGRASAL